MKNNLLLLLFLFFTCQALTQVAFERPDTAVKYLQLVPLVSAPDSIYGEDSICVNQGYEYRCNSADGHTVHWIANNGSPSTSSGSRIGVRWGAMGPRKIGAYLVSNSPPYRSGDTLWRNIYPKTAGVVAISGLSSVCPSTELSYTVNADVDAYVWTVNGGSIIHGQNSDSIVVLWNNNPGTAQITLVMTACVFYPPISYPVNIITPPSLQISPADPEYCLGENLNFTASFSLGSATSNYLWYENGSLTQNASSDSYSTSFSSTGTKAITVKCVNSVCQDSITVSQTFNIVSPPKAHIGLQSGALDDCDSAGYFNATLFVTQESPGSYTNSWGGSTLTITTDSTVNCTVSDIISGCTSVSNTIIIEPCDTNNSPGCVTDTTYEFRTTLSATCDSIIATGSPTHTSFLFLNGDSSTVPGSVPISNAGFYSVTLLPSVCYPARDTVIEIPFVADFEYSFECNSTGDSLKTQFNDRSTFTTGAPTSWSWSINSGVWTSTSQNPSFNLPSDSCFSVTLTAGGCTKTKNICTPAAPLANFNILSKTPVCEGFPVEFQDASSGFIISHLWNFENSKFYGKRYGAKATFVFSPSNPDIDNASLRIQDIYGCKHSLTKFFETKENNLDYSLYPTSLEACENDSVVLRPTRLSGMSAAHTNFLWNTGDTTNSIIINSTGKYILSLVDSNRCIDNNPTNNISRTLFHPLPELSIQGDLEIYKLDTLNLLALGDTNLSYTWFDTIFPLGKSGRRFQRFYPYAGPNSVRLQVENSNTNCINDKIFDMLIHPEADTLSNMQLDLGLKYDLLGKGPWKLEVIGTGGQVLINKELQNKSGNESINLERYPPGVYQIRTTSRDGKRAFQKVILIQ